MSSNIQPIIEPVPRDLLLEELSSERFVRNTNKAGNEIYIVNHHNSPNTLREIGRLREIAFREAGGGTGKAIDLDEQDTGPRCYDQLVVWSPEEQEIVGGYRFITGSDGYNPETDNYELSTAHYFELTPKMRKEYLPYAIELGRSWVQPSYQPSVNPRKGLFALMNIWDGLGSLVIRYPSIKFLFGKVTMYKHYNKEARDLLLSFMGHYFPSRPDLCKPKKTLASGYSSDLFKELFRADPPFDDGFKILNKALKERGEYVPPLINIYMGLSKTMMTFGTAQNPDFGDVEETGILVTIKDIHQSVKDRHIYY
ncbi:MAG: GNAT family N-acetyltransferase [Bacteroidota bacterium]